jgi:hypothetical protein
MELYNLYQAIISMFCMKENNTNILKNNAQPFAVAIGVAVGVVALLFALLGQNAMNTKDGYATLSYHWFEDVFNRKTGITTTEWTEQEFVIPYLTTAFYALVALGLGLVSTGMGIASNILKKDSKLLAYLPGVVTSVLAMMCFLSTVFTNK